jgi:hypothetical protein
MNDKQIAISLLERWHKGGETILRRPMSSKPAEGAAALVDGGTCEEIGKLAPAFWRHGRWETCLREPVSIRVTHWTQFASDINADASATFIVGLPE